MCATHIGNPYIYFPQTTLAFESFLLVVYMLPPHSLPSNKPRLMLAIRGLSAAVRIDEKSAFVAKTPRLRCRSRTRMPIARIPGFLVQVCSKTPIVNKCFARSTCGQVRSSPWRLSPGISLTSNFVWAPRAGIIGNIE